MSVHWVTCRFPGRRGPSLSLCLFSLQRSQTLEPRGVCFSGTGQLSSEPISTECKKNWADISQCAKPPNASRLPTAGNVNKATVGTGFFVRAVNLLCADSGSVIAQTSRLTCGSPGPRTVRKNRTKIRLESWSQHGDRLQMCTELRGGAPAQNAALAARKG